MEFLKLKQDWNWHHMAMEQAQIFSLRLIGGETFMEPN